MPTTMAYRDDREALEGQKAELEAKLGALRAKLAESRGLEEVMLATVRELEGTYAKLNAVKTKTGERGPQRSLPLLQHVYIASPCAVPWESMTGDERERLCASCNKSVYDVSQMTTAEAEELLRTKGTEACLRIFRRFDGTILTADCPVGVAKKKRARRRNVVAGVLAATAAAAVAAVTLRERSRDTGCDRTAHNNNGHGTNTNLPVDGVQLPPGAMIVSVPPVPEVPEPTQSRSTSTRGGTSQRSRRVR